MRKDVPEFVADVSRLGVDEVAALVQTVITTLDPQWLMIDAYGAKIPAGRVTDAKEKLLRFSPKNGGASIRIDPSDAEMVQALVTFAPYSAGVDLGIDGPTTTLVEVRDGEWIGLLMTSEEIERTGMTLDPVIWQELERSPKWPELERPPKRARWWRRQAHDPS